MGKTFSTGLLTNGIWQDSSNNIGIGGAANASYKLAVTGASLFSGALTADGAASEGSIKIERDSVAANTVIGSLAFTNNNSATTYGKVFGGRNAAGDGYVALGTGISNNLYALETGNVGIGTSTPDTKLQVAGTGATGLSVRTNTSGDAFMRLYRDSTIYAHWYADRTNSKVTFGAVENVPLTFDTNGTERMRITSGGNVVLNSTSAAGYVLESYGDAGKYNVYFKQTNNSASYPVQTNEHAATSGTRRLLVFAVTGSDVGSITSTGSSTAYNTTSDYRLKEDFKNYNGLELISKIKTYDFKWKNEEERNFGVIAHEFAEILPYAVTGEKDEIKENGDVMPQGVDYSKLVPVLVKAIQELSAKVTALENKA